MIFKNKYFNICFIFSLALHVVWLSSIYIVVTPTASLQEGYAEINFLGPILEKTAFEIMAEESFPHFETLYQTQAILETEAQLKIGGPDKLTKKVVFQDKIKKDAFVKKKEDQISEGSIFYHLEEKVLNRFMEGPARNRAVLFKPSFSNLTGSSFSDEEIFVIKLKFTLSEDGNVEQVEPVVLSGYPDLDFKCIKYLKQWKFSPRAGHDHKKDWGIITLNVRTE